MDCCGELSRTLIASSVNGSSHGNGPTFDCQTKLYGLHIFNSSITSDTLAPTSDGYASPRLTVYRNGTKIYSKISIEKPNKIRKNVDKTHLERQ